MPAVSKVGFWAQWWMCHVSWARQELAVRGKVAEHRGFRKLVLCL